MTQFWVVGGEYESTSFKNLASGQKEVREGPFESYDDAVKAWQSHAWATVDNALAHFHIEEIETGLPDPDQVKETQYWVIGGSFDSLDFENWSDATENYGPFLTYEEAEKKWQQMAWQTVDDAAARYRIETLSPSTKKPKPRLAYRYLTGGDDRAFCEKVSQALADGYVLHGSPALSVKPDGSVVCAQAVILPKDLPKGSCC